MGREETQMTKQATIRMLQAGFECEDAADWRRKAARIAWVQERIAALRAAHKAADQAWERLLSAFPEDVSEEELETIQPPPEDAEAESILAELNAVIDEDRWPERLYFGGL